ncbi:MAG: T9SS type A sorting domain-containing protein [Chitinophagales bacterium]
MRLKALNNKLADYSLLSGAFILMYQGAAGQVVYTDIDPDTVFDANNEGAFFDIDSNGAFDFTVLNLSVTFLTDLYSNLFNYDVIFAVPYAPDNFVAGNAFEYYYGSIYFPYALNFNSLIDNNLDWNNAPLQILGFHLSTNNIPNLCNYCNWYGEFTPESIDKFLGLKFTDSDGLYHYGWLRCDLKDEGRTLIVKDYAYELQPEKPLLAGDTVSHIDTSTAIQEATIYSFNNTIYVNIPNYQNTQITVYDISGNKIYNKSLEGNSEIINMENFAAGIYVVSVKQGENVVTKKVIVE